MAGTAAADTRTRRFNRGDGRMSLMSEFREFAAKGNVVDLAVGVIIGAAFGKIVDSLVRDVIMPIAGRIFGGFDFSSHFVALASPPAGYRGPQTYDALTKAGVPVLAYGNFLTVVVNFLILAFIIFLMVKAINRLRRAQPPAVATAEDVVLLREIRDALKTPAPRLS
jgi:large conductance mechanosensitive channel